MGRYLKKIKKQKREMVISKYTKQAYDNGVSYGMKESAHAFLSKVRELKEIEGIDDQLFDEIVEKLNVKDLI